MSGIATAIVVSAVVGGVVAHNQGKKSQEAIRDSTASAERTAQSELQELQRQYDLLREDMAPFRETGLTANTLLDEYYAGDLSGFVEDPGRQFQLEEGTKSVNRLAAQQGRLNTGAQDKNLLRFSQGLANQGIQEYLNNLLVASGRGQAATGSVGAAGLQTGLASANVLGNLGSIQGQNALLSGQVRAGTYQDYGNVINNALNQGVQYYGYNQGAGGGQPASYYGSGNPNVPGDAYAPAYGS